LNEENVAVQKALQAQASAANASAASSSKHKSGGGHKDGSASKAGASTRKDGGRGTKRGREEVSGVSLLIIPSSLCSVPWLTYRSSSSQDEGNKKPEMKLNVPEILKVKLVDDWEAVTKNNQVCSRFTKYRCNKMLTAI